jgi:intracellular sulfur oxidation DsrE/DsrF family protein
VRTVFVLNNDQMGVGDRQLGQRLLSTALRKLANDKSGKNVEAVVLYNAGVLLAVKDSFLVTELRLLEERGVDVLPCGTCVDHYGVQDQLALDHVSNMDEILATLNAADKVITL